MRDVPDILGMELNAASALLEAEGLAFIVKETKPTRGIKVDGILRVIKVKQVPKQLNGIMSEKPSDSVDVVLTVCRI